jgi:hypothetical protein
VNTTLSVPAANAKASADMQKVHITFDYIKYSAFRISPSITNQELASYIPGVDFSKVNGVRIILGGHLSISSDIEIKNADMSGNLFGALSVAMATGKATSFVNCSQYGLDNIPHINEIIGLIKNKDSITLDQIASMLQVIQTFTDDPKSLSHPAIVGYELLMKDPLAPAVQVKFDPTQAAKVKSLLTKKLMDLRVQNVSSVNMEMP